MRFSLKTHSIVFKLSHILLTSAEKRTVLSMKSCFQLLLFQNRVEFHFLSAEKKDKKVKIEKSTRIKYCSDALQFDTFFWFSI